MNVYRQPLFIANWKMNKTALEAEKFFEIFHLKFVPSDSREVIICPPFTLLSLVRARAQGKTAVGAQDLFWKPEGAYTGEISPKMLVDAGCTHVIIGHSERRQYFGETDESVNRKVHAALTFGLVPIVCVGETLQEMESGKTRQVVERQVKEAFRNLPSQSASRDSDRSKEAKLILAYEPVWAIGTGKADTPEVSNQTIQFIRQAVGGIFGESASRKIRILYGGSVKPANIGSFMAQPEIDGGLVGGASLDPETFLQILNYEASKY